MNYELAMFQPRTVTAPHLGSVPIDEGTRPESSEHNIKVTKCANLKLILRYAEEDNYIIKYTAIFMML